MIEGPGTVRQLPAQEIVGRLGLEHVRVIGGAIQQVPQCRIAHGEIFRFEKPGDRLGTERFAPAIGHLVCC